MLCACSMMVSLPDPDGKWCSTTQSPSGGARQKKGPAGSSAATDARRTAHSSRITVQRQNAVSGKSTTLLRQTLRKRHI